MTFYGEAIMTICERIFYLIEEKKLKTSELAKKLNIKQSVITNWKKRNTTPPLEYALVICEFLQITLEYLITGKENNENTPEEKELIKYYRAADQRGKRTIMRTAKEEAQEQESYISVTG